MCVFDANVYLGWPAVRQPGAFTDAAGLTAAMVANGIDSALVYHPAAINADLADANLRLVSEAAAMPNIHAAWVLLPPGTGEIAAPAILVADMLRRGVRAARLMPRAHGYAVRVRTLGPLLECLAEHRIPALLDFGLSAWGDRTHIDWDGVHEICTAFPALPVVLIRLGLMVDRDLYPMLAHHENLYVETSYYFGHRGLQALVARFGARRLIFGTGMPVYAPGPPIATLAYSGLSSIEQQMVASGNLERLLQEVRP
jgi:predicted TIM-barrel fold metal-dependent hydrolase